MCLVCLTHLQLYINFKKTPLKKKQANLNTCEHLLFSFHLQWCETKYLPDSCTLSANEVNETLVLLFDLEKRGNAVAYLHQIFALHTPPHWPSPAACPGNDGQMSHNCQLHPSLASVNNPEKGEKDIK